MTTASATRRAEGLRPYTSVADVNGDPSAVFSVVVDLQITLVVGTVSPLGLC